MDFQQFLDVCQAEALANKISPTEVSVWRGLCRKYSKKFHTPLPEVEKLPLRQVILNVYEDQLEEIDMEEHLDDIMEALYRIEDPDYDRSKEDSIQDFIKQAEKEEEARIKAGKPVHKALLTQPSLKKTLPENEEVKEENKPTSGFIDLSYLEKEEQ